MLNTLFISNNLMLVQSLYPYHNSNIELISLQISHLILIYWMYGICVLRICEHLYRQYFRIKHCLLNVHVYL